MKTSWIGLCLLIAVPTVMAGEKHGTVISTRCPVILELDKNSDWKVSFDSQSYSSCYYRGVPDLTWAPVSRSVSDKSCPLSPKVRATLPKGTSSSPLYKWEISGSTPKEPNSYQSKGRFAHNSCRATEMAAFTLTPTPVRGGLCFSSGLLDDDGHTINLGNINGHFTCVSPEAVASCKSTGHKLSKLQHLYAVEFKAFQDHSNQMIDDQNNFREFATVYNDICTNDFLDFLADIADIFTDDLVSTIKDLGCEVAYVAIEAYKSGSISDVEAANRQMSAALIKLQHSIEHLNKVHNACKKTLGE